MRKLNEEELAIIAVKEKRLGRKLDVAGIEYRKAFPRTTVCILNKDTPINGGFVIGVSMRSKGEPDVPHIGEVTSFVRALEAL